MTYHQLFNECRREINAEIREKAKKRIKGIMIPIYYYKSIGNRQKIKELSEMLDKLANIQIEDHLMK